MRKVRLEVTREVAGMPSLVGDHSGGDCGKYSEVKDSRDRYVNTEVSYLHQRMEAYHGVAILTTNVQELLDPAFLPPAILCKSFMLNTVSFVSA